MVSCQGFWGGRRQWQDGHGMFKIAAGWTSWPAVEVRAPWLEGRLSASRDAPWGNLRMEAMWTLGQRTSMAGSNDGVARAELPWGWTAWWLGRGTDGSWSQARHVECVWRMDEGFSAGFVGMAGRGDVSDAFVMVPALDARRWSRLPHHGQRMGLWCANRHEGHGWTLQWTWSPSQQETFRCAMRWRWDA